MGVRGLKRRRQGQRSCTAAIDSGGGRVASLQWAKAAGPALTSVNWTEPTSPSRATTSCDKYSAMISETYSISADRRKCPVPAQAGETKECARKSMNPRQHALCADQRANRCKQTASTGRRFRRSLACSQLLSSHGSSAQQRAHFQAIFYELCSLAKHNKQNEPKSSMALTQGPQRAN